MKMCAGLSSASIDWTKTTLFFVNHKTVSNDDDLATIKKAKALFLDSAKGCTVHTLGGSSDAAAEAKEYDQRLRAAMQSGSIATCPKSSNPSFDLMLLGVGSDGHIGSLYPSRPEVEIDDGRFVLPVVKGGGGPASVTLSLPVMNAARSVVIALTGEKKAAAVRQALEEAPPPGGFPAQQVKARSRTWLLDAGAASGLAAAAALRDLH